MPIQTPACCDTQYELVRKILLTLPAISGGGGGGSAEVFTDGSQKTQIVDGSGNVVGTTNNALDVNIKSSTTLTVNTHNVTNAGTFAVQASITGSLPAGTNVLGHVITDATSTTIATQATGTNLHTVVDSGVITSITNVVQVADNGGSLTVDNAGTFAVQASIADGASVTLGAKADAKSTATDATPISAISILKQISASVQAPVTQPVTNVGIFAVQASGDIANDAVDSGNPLKIGGLAKTANPTAVADGDRVNGLFDKVGKQIVVGSIRVLKARQVTIITSSTAETTIVTANAAAFLDIYGLILSNTSATATEVTIRDATAGGTITSFMVPASDTRGFMLPEGGAIPQATLNNNWTATCATSVASLKVTALFVQNL